MAAVGLQGAEQLAALSQVLKRMGDKDLQRQLSRSGNEVATAFRRAVRFSALDTLPKRGGLNKVVAAKLSPRTQRRASSSGAGIRVVAVGKKGMRDLAALDAGTVRHPVFGRRSKWIAQDVPAGFWTRPAESMQGHAQALLEQAMEAVKDQIEGAA